MPRPTHWAFLIGINDYGSAQNALSGCVADVHAMTEILIKNEVCPPHKIFVLTSMEPPDRHPTYQNIITGLEQLIETVPKGEGLIFYFSGHGARLPTIVPEAKGNNGIDEALVPCDVDKEHRFIRDVELAFLCQKAVQAGILLTIILDCCHGGGLSRKGGGTTRQWQMSAKRKLARGSLLPRQKLMSNWRDSTLKGDRLLDSSSGWLPNPRGYVLLAACRDTELANEYSFAGETHGCLTWFLTQLLKHGMAQMTWRALHQRLQANVRASFSDQTPQLEGEMDRKVFGNVKGNRERGFLVLDFNPQTGTVRLAGGHVHGLRPGMQLLGDHLGNCRVEITRLDATQAEAKVFGVQPVPGSYLHMDLEQSLNLWVDPRVSRGMGLGSQATIKIVNEPEKAQFGLVLEGNQIVLRNHLGDAFKNLHLPNRSDPHFKQRLLDWLGHLAAFEHVRQLRSPDHSKLKDAIELVVGKLPAYQHGDKPGPTISINTTPAYVQAGEWVYLEIRNLSKRILYVAALCLSSLQVTQVFPLPTAGECVPLFPGEARMLPFRAALAPSENQSRDLIKVFATIRELNLSSLELNQPGQGPSRHSANLPTINQALGEVYVIEQKEIVIER